MNNKSFYSVALVCAFLALLSGACFVGCSEDDDSDIIMRQTLAEEMMTRSGENMSQDETVEMIQKSTICAVPLKDVTQDVSFSVKTKLRWTKKITKTTTAYGASIESISIEGITFDNSEPSLDQENNSETLKISSFHASAYNSRMDGDMVRFSVSSNCLYETVKEIEKGEKIQVTGTAVYPGGEMTISTKD